MMQLDKLLSDFETHVSCMSDDDVKASAESAERMTAECEDLGSSEPCIDLQPAANIPVTNRIDRRRAEYIRGCKDGMERGRVSGRRRLFTGYDWHLCDSCKFCIASCKGHPIFNMQPEKDNVLWCDHWESKAEAKRLEKEAHEKLAPEIVHCRDCKHWRMAGDMTCPMSYEQYYYDEDLGGDYEQLDNTPDDGYGFCHMGEKWDA